MITSPLKTYTMRLIDRSKSVEDLICNAIIRAYQAKSGIPLDQAEKKEARKIIRKLVKNNLRSD